MRNEEAIKIKLLAMYKILQENPNNKDFSRYLQPQIKLLEWVLEME